MSLKQVWSRASLMKRIMMTLFVSLIILTFSTLWFVFGHIGLKPWNNKCYTRHELIQYARDQHLFSVENAHCHNRKLLLMDTEVATSESLVFPIYRMFDRDGRLLQQHCCFESVPGFIDSSRNNSEWSERQARPTLSLYLQELQSLQDATPLTNHENPDFTIIYYWDTTLDYNIQKARALIDRVGHDSIHIRLIMVNLNCMSTA